MAAAAQGTDLQAYLANPSTWQPWYRAVGYVYDGAEQTQHPGFWLNVSRNESWRMPDGAIGCGVPQCNNKHHSIKAAKLCEGKHRSLTGVAAGPGSKAKARIAPLHPADPLGSGKGPLQQQDAEAAHAPGARGEKGEHMRWV